MISLDPILASVTALQVCQGKVPQNDLTLFVLIPQFGDAGDALKSEDMGKVDIRELSQKRG